MEWFNIFGFIFICIIMIPNVVFAIKCKDGFENKWNNKFVETIEQIKKALGLIIIKNNLSQVLFSPF